MTLTAVHTHITITFESAKLLRNAMLADQGSVAITGQAASFTYTKGIFPSNVSVALTTYPAKLWDTANGTHDNTMQTEYSGEHYLKCKHADGVLTGTYISPLYDLTSSGRYLIYVLCDIVVTGAGTTWDDLVPVPQTWDDLGSRTWDEIYNLSAAPSVNIAVDYGDSFPPTSRVEKLEILTAIVTARYYRVEITITDPSEEVFALVENFTMKFCQ